tara:strand:+ start:564 stop:1145 length:582 start_codon:yes stop_codon:yes gene_type:complete
MPAINLYFPTPIYIEYDLFNEEQNINWTTRLLELQKTVSSGGESWEGNTYTTHGKFDLLDDILFRPLIEKIQSHVNEFTKAHNSDFLHTCNSAWGNINTINTFQEYHSHPGSVFSCVYYPKVPVGSGSIVFENPLAPDMMPVKNVTVFNDLTQERIDYRPKEGMLLIFRSYLRHCVQSGTNADPRVSISLNFG